MFHCCSAGEKAAYEFELSKMNFLFVMQQWFINIHVTLRRFPSFTKIDCVVIEIFIASVINFFKFLNLSFIGIAFIKKTPKLILFWVPLMSSHVISFSLMFSHLVSLNFGHNCLALIKQKVMFLIIGLLTSVYSRWVILCLICCTRKWSVLMYYYAKVFTHIMCIGK